MTSRNRRVNNFGLDLKRYPKNGLLTQPALWAIAVYRFGRFSYSLPNPFRFLFSVVYFVLFSIVRLMTGIEIPRSAVIGGGLMIHHFGGIIIHPKARIGANFTARQGLTVGSRKDQDDVPVIQDNVTVGAYAQILGDICIGRGSTIGAMSLVIADVRPGATVFGIPAKEKMSG